MTAHAITITLPTWLRRPSAPAPGDSGWQAAVAALRAELAADRQAHAEAIAGEQAAREALAGQLARTQAELTIARAETAAERKERELLASYARMLQTNLEQQTRLILEQTDVIGQLRERLSQSEHSREAQGRRIGVLELQVNELPPLRDRALRAEMIARIWRDDAKDLRRRLSDAGIVAPEQPAIPDVPDTEAAS